ncbi:hypothetical protein CANARDRAFT_174145 [[Candida] arabinofermentans NRRL YB-2248]|uniref:Uncharacterized protein n=1 Tax=[Candida] arabinofermentans NRRL YB-2248 TaxID=983967 RepID=A0A1E4T994_9ASCO|nr:hypothetical protein CANARDRAFT_174145 [[Candida] arabinofermentans NRRL YB-2248]
MKIIFPNLLLENISTMQNKSYESKIWGEWSDIKDCLVIIVEETSVSVRAKVLLYKKDLE